MRDVSASGWKPNLAFPTLRFVFDPSRNDLALLVAAVLGCLALTWWLARPRRSGVPTSSGGFGPRLALMSVAVIIISVSTVATTLSQRWTNADYLPEEDSALRKAAEALLEHDRCRVCFTSRDGPFDWRALEPNPAREIRLATVRVDRRSVFFEAHVEPSARPTGFGRLMIEFGDGAAFPWTGIVGARQVVHLYEKPGVYQVAAWLQLPNGSVSVNRQTVTISGSGGGT